LIPLASEVPTWAFVLTAVFAPVIGLAGGLAAALVGPWGEGLTRRDQLKSYKRNVYRNFLDHGYWYQRPDRDTKAQKERGVLYVADWHRIQLITEDAEVARVIKTIGEPEDFNDEIAKQVLEAFKKELGSGGLDE
jgi:hypothetical protein